MAATKSSVLGSVKPLRLVDCLIDFLDSFDFRALLLPVRSFAFSVGAVLLGPLRDSALVVDPPAFLAAYQRRIRFTAFPTRPLIHA